MILEHMEKGFLENIIDMFKHDESLFPLIIDMLLDERMRVRLGAIALVEEMVSFKQENFVRLIPQISGLLNNPNATVRGDAAHLLGLINHPDALPFLLNSYNDKDPNVREIAKESVLSINTSEM